MKKLFLPLFIITLSVSLSFAAAVKVPGVQRTSNGVGYHAWAPATPTASSSGDTLVFMADTTTGRANNVKWFSTASLRPAAPILNPPFQDSLRLLLVINGDADGSIITTLGEISYNNGVSWVTMKSQADTTTGTTYVSKLVTMPFVPDVLYRWRTVTTSATDVTNLAHARDFVTQR